MADIEQLIKDGIIGASIAVATDTVLHAGVPIETAAVLGGATAEVFGISNKREYKPRSEPSRSTNYTRSRRDNDINRDLFRIQSNTTPSYAQGGGFNRVHLFHHDGDKDETHAPFSQGDGSENFAFTEGSNYAERFGYEPFEQDADKESQKVTKHNTPPREVQESIDKWAGKSPSKPCEKHGIDMPTNSCYSCGSGGGMCDHLAKYDGSHKSTHCVYPETRLEVAAASKRIGKPIKQHRNINRTHLTGIERGHLLALADDTLVDDKDSLKQEMADHIDPALSYGENKTALQDYLAGVTPANTDITEQEIRETEARINQIDPIQMEQANDPFLLESLKERAANGDSSAGMQLELMDINREQYAMQNPDMSWNSSTPETLKFSETFEQPVETFNPVESWGAPAIEMPKSSINQHNVL